MANFTLLPGEIEAKFFPGATIPYNSVECEELFKAWEAELLDHARQESERSIAEHQQRGEEWRQDSRGKWAWRKVRQRS